VVCQTGATQTFAPTGWEQCYTVPEGVRSVHVTATGAPGAGGGAGARATRDVTVWPGQVLWVGVGTPGSGSSGGWPAAGGAGGFNGGGDGGSGGSGGQGGGGASDVRDCRNRATERSQTREATVTPAAMNR